MTDLEQLGREVVAGELDLAAAERRLDEITAPRPGGLLSGTLPTVLISAPAAVFLGGGLAEAAVAGLAAAMIAVLEALAARRGSRERLVPPTAACLAAFGISAGAQWIPGLSPPLALVASLIALVPGLEFTLAIKEISTENLVSGSSRLTSAIGDFLLLAFGVALGTQLAAAAFGAPAVREPLQLPEWSIIVALVVAAIGFTLRFGAHHRDVGWIGVSCTISWLSVGLGNAWLGPDLGVLIAALSVGMAANARARWSGTSSMVMMIPGLILLVPGSFGLRAIDLMVQNDVVLALGTVFSMLLIATALSTGLLLANLLLPSERKART